MVFIFMLATVTHLQEQKSEVADSAVNSQPRGTQETALVGFAQSGRQFERSPGMYVTLTFEMYARAEVC